MRSGLRTRNDEDDHEMNNTSFFAQDFKNEAAEILVNILDGKEHDSSQEFLRS
jgi:hypothetical protein